MDEEELYDSLDDEIYYDTFRSAQLPPPTRPPRVYDISTIVPLYGRETLKDDIKPPKKSITKSKTKIPLPVPPNKSTASPANERCAGRFKAPPAASNDVDFVKLEKSYANIFYQRTGHPKGTVKAVPNDTERSQWGDSTTRTESSYKSVLTHFSDGDSATSRSDSTSFYLNLIKRNDSPASTSKTTIAKGTLCTASDFNLRSVSEYSIVGRGKVDKRNLHMTVPKLGGLGPDMETIKDKLSLFKKRTAYGQKANTHNKIKMMEMKVLKELDKELKDANRSSAT